jgi:hypothetical protein
MGDVVFKGFQCLNPECEEFIFVRKDQIKSDFEISCPKCGSILRSGDSTRVYDFDVVRRSDATVLQTGEFTISHDDYLAEAQEYKYCIICNTMKPLAFFDRHRRRVSGRQGECNLCKAEYNRIKNPTRLSDQHREAAQMRRLLLDLSGVVRLDTAAIYERFDYRCFRCGRDLRNVASEQERPIDHTLPVMYLWPATTDNSTLLCRDHNGEKSGRWPSEYYSPDEIRRLSVLTGLDFDLLAGPPLYNPDVMRRLKDGEYVDRVLARSAGRMDEILKLRNRLLRDTGFDLFQHSHQISGTWVAQADRILQHQVAAADIALETDEVTEERDTGDQ